MSNGTDTAFDLKGLLESQGIDHAQFNQLSLVEKDKAFEDLIPGYKTLPAQERQKALQELAAPETQFERERTGKKPGYLGEAMESFKGFAKSAVSYDPTQGLEAKDPQIAAEARDAARDRQAQSRAADVERQKSGRSWAYRKLDVPAGEALGVNMERQEHAADIGDPGGVMGTTAAPMAIAATDLAVKGVRGSRSVSHPIETLQGGLETAGKEDVFRASVPGAGAKDFNLRDNVSVAASDLAEIQRQTPLEGKGGVIRPDMRLRNFANNGSDNKAE